MTATSAGNQVTITGSPIVYSTAYHVNDQYGTFRETMLPGVAKQVMTDDCRFLVNHSGMALARTRSGTLKLRDTPTALTFEATLDLRQQAANDLVIAIERGDINQMSCGFVVGSDSWNKAMDQRSILRLKQLLDVISCDISSITNNQHHDR